MKNRTVYRPDAGAEPATAVTVTAGPAGAFTSGDDPLVLYARVRDAAGAPPVDLTRVTTGRPRLTESWFCCAEPTELQLTRIGAQGDSSDTCC